jgi:mannose-6-phosphate isomerase-like protein (cupin superfamily)
MPRVIRSNEASMSGVRLPTGNAKVAVFLTQQDFRSGVRGFGVRSLDPGVRIEPADVGDVEEVWFVFSGIGEVITGDGGRLPVQPGDVVFTGPGDRRGIANVGMEELVFAAFAVTVPKAT